MKLFVPDSFEPVDFEEFLRGHPHERAEVRFLESVALKEMSVIDIGANVGITSVAIANRIGKRGLVYSFEPVPEYFDILKKNTSSKGLENVSPYELAVTDQAGRANFYQKGLSTGIVFQEGATEFEVSTTTIDKFSTAERIRRLDLVNMDCEGSELLVLKGAEATLQQNTVRIFCEIHHDFLRQLGQSVEDIVEYLEGLSFQVQTVSLADLTMGNNFENCEYIYAHNLDERRNYAHV